MLSILVVDDEDNTRLGMSQLLTQKGFLVTALGHGREALVFLEHNVVDLIISDIKMPGMNGIVFAREVRKRRPQQKIILVTALPRDDQLAKTQDFTCLAKPINLSVLYKQIKEECYNQDGSIPALGVPAALY